MAFYFIQNQLRAKEPDWQILSDAFTQTYAGMYIAIILLLTFLNRFLEILKWKNLAQCVLTISVGEATRQVLMAITLGILTPNGIGEYAGKALFYPGKNAARIIFLNAICNGVQVIYALLFGIAGTFFIHSLHPFLPSSTGWILTGILVIMPILLFSLKNISFKGYSIQKIFTEIRLVPRYIHRKNLVLAFRYTVLLHQYFFLYRFFGVETDYIILLAVVSSVYLLASSLPNFQALDFALKGSVALFLFSFFDVDEWVITIVATMIWLLNLVIPVGIGSVFVILFKPGKKFVSL